jgi:hypothetical protein
VKTATHPRGAVFSADPRGAAPVPANRLRAPQYASRQGIFIGFLRFWVFSILFKAGIMIYVS